MLARIKLADLCRELGLEPNEKGRVARCPAHNDQNRPNLVIYPKNVHCFACGFNGDAFDLVAKVRGCDFEGAFDFLAGRLGLPLIGDYRKSTQGKGRGLGYKAGAKPPDVYPKAAPLPDSPSPTLTAGLGNDAQGKKATAYPKPAADRSLPAALHRRFDDFADAWAYYQSPELAGYERGLRRDRVAGCYIVTGLTTSVPDPATDGEADDQGEPRQSPKVEAFAALLGLATPASETQAGDWLKREKGIVFETQDRFGLAWLDDPAAVERDLRGRFDEGSLRRFGILGETEDKGTGAKRIYFSFYRHRLLFPFFWRGLPVDIQGRDIDAKDKQGRFRNTSGKNAIPYNADALVAAKTTSTPLFICEGATDTLALAQSGRHVVGIVGTGGFKREWLPQFAGVDVYLALDNDDPGRKAATDISRLFVDAGHPAPKVVTLPEGVKDVNELLRRETAK